MAFRDRLIALVRWCAPSGGAATVAAVAAGLVEGATLDGASAIATATGLIVIAGLPVLLTLALVVRATWRAWRPSHLAEALTEDGGGMPGFAGWVVYLWLAALALAAAVFTTTHMIAAQTQFRPLIVGFIQPLCSVVIALVLVAGSRPAARGLAGLARALDRRWRSRGWRTLLTPTRVVVGLGAITVAAVVGTWLWARGQLGHLELRELAMPPVVAIVVLVAFHQVRALRARLGRWIVRGAVVVAVGAIVTTGYAVTQRPGLTLAVWTEGALSGVIIDVVFDLDAIRDDVSLEMFRPVARAGSSSPDLILITIDTVRADRTPPYGGTAAMPFLEGLADRGVVFEWAFAPSNVTRRSIPSMVTGLRPNRVRGRVRGWALRLDPRHVLLAERLRAGGYETAGFMCCDGFWGPSSRTGLARGLEHVEIEKQGGVLAKRARAWIERREQGPRRRPLFLWMHLLEPHNWAGGTEPPSSVVQRQMYDRVLAQADKMVADVVGGFAKRGPADAPIVIVTADHGEALGDHGQSFHSTDLYNSQIRVPFVIAGPGIKPGRIAETVSLTDLTATVIELGGFTPPETDGRSLAPLLTGARAPAVGGGLAFAVMIKDRSNPGGVAAIVVGRWKLIVTGQRTELYDLDADPDELHDVAALHPDRVATMRRELAAREQVTRPVFAE